jgi:hypothetical protein
MARYTDAVHWLAKHGGFDTNQPDEIRERQLAAAQGVRMTAEIYSRGVAIVVQDVMRLQQRLAEQAARRQRDAEPLEAEVA